MNLAEDITTKAYSDVFELENNNDAMSKILAITKMIKDRLVTDWSLDGLVDTVFTLCKIMDNLSELKDNAKLEADAIEEEYDSSVRDEYLRIKGEGKISDALAKATAEQKYESLVAEGIVRKHYWKRLDDLYQYCDRLINFTQTKTKSAVDSRIRTNIPNN